MGGDWLPPDMSKIVFSSLREGIKPMTEDVRDAINDAGKRIRKAAVESFGAIGKDKDIKKGFKLFGPKFTKTLKKIAPFVAIGLDILGIILQVLDALGVLEPIMKLFNGVLQMIGGTIMQTIAPALQHLAEVLFDPETMVLWKVLGVLIGVVLAAALNTFASVLKALTPILLPLIALLVGPLVISIYLIIKAVGLLIVGALLPLMTTIYGFGMVIAGIMQFFGVAGAIANWHNLMFPIVHGLAQGAFEILTMGTGGVVTRPTLALIGESGPEAVLPLNQEGQISGMGAGDQSVLWATEDNGDKLDKLIKIMSSRTRQ